MTAAEGEIYIILEPAGKGNMPSPPKFLDVF
jgi:hypothetical protein